MFHDTNQVIFRVWLADVAFWAESRPPVPCGKRPPQAVHDLGVSAGDAMRGALLARPTFVELCGHNMDFGFIQWIASRESAFVVCE